MLEEIEIDAVHYIECFLPSSPPIVQNREETNQAYLRRIIKIALDNMDVTEVHISNHSDPVVSEHYSWVARIIRSQLETKYSKIGSWTTNKANAKAEKLLKSGSVGTRKLSNVNGVVFTWYISIPSDNSDEYQYQDLDDFDFDLF